MGKTVYLGKPKNRREERKLLVKKLDNVFSQRVRIRHKGEFGPCCQFCGFRGKSPRPIEDAFHVFSRTHYATRWDERNTEASCRDCNLVYEHDAGFQRRVTDWFIAKRGQQAWDEIERLYHTTAKFSNEDLRAMYDAMTGNVAVP